MTSDIETLAAVEGIMLHSRGADFNKFFLVYQQFKTEKEPGKIAKAIEWLATNFEFIKSDNTEEIKEYITQAEANAFNERFQATVHSMLRSLVESNPKESDFYLRVWEITNNAFFPDEKAHSLALYTIINARVTPFFHIESVENIGEDEWEEVIRKTRSSRQKIQFILQRGLKTKYQQADALLQAIEAVDGKERRVLLAALVDTVEYFAQRKVAEALNAKR